MSRLFRSNSSVSSRFTTLAFIPDDTIINEEHEFRDVKIDLSWNIPKVPIKDIYKTSFLKPYSNIDLHVKTVEQDYALTKIQETCHLLSKESIKKYISAGHNFIHVGLIQAAVKPLTQ